MRKLTLKLLPRIGATVAIVALVAPASYAQCLSARNFDSFFGGKNVARVFIDASGFQDNNNELAQFWQTGTPSNGTGPGPTRPSPPS